MAARATALTKTTAPGSYPTDGVAITFTAADAVNKDQFVMSGDDLLLVHNTHGSTGYTFTITSIADPHGRTADIATEAIAAGVVRVLGPFKNKVGWVQSDGNLYLEANNAAVKFAVIKLPRP